VDILPNRIVEVESLDQPVRLHATGDWHLGERGCVEARLKRDIESIAADDSAMVLLMGDLAGCIAPDDARRFDPASVSQSLTIEQMSDWGNVCVELVVDAAQPIIGRIVGVLEGNHESGYRQRHHQRITRQIASRLGAPEIGYSCMFTIRFVAGREHRDLTVMATHGSGAAATPGGKLNRLIRFMHSADADLVLMGHVHDCLSYGRARIYQHGQRIGEREQLGVVTGTYLATYSQGHSGYGERAGYAPVRLGHPVIEITPRTLAMSVGWV
jgi:predicted phosphodiesterase